MERQTERLERIVSDSIDGKRKWDETVQRIGQGQSKEQKAKDARRLKALFRAGRRITARLDRVTKSE